MKKNILLRTNVLVCLIIVIGFLVTAILSYKANYTSSLKNIEQVSSLSSEGIYYQLANTFTKPVNISLTMANDHLLKTFLADEKDHLDDENYTETIRSYLQTYQQKYEYDSVFLVSDSSRRYYNFNGLDRVLDDGNPENKWYYNLLDSTEDYALVVDNDEVVGADNAITVFVNCKIRDDEGTVMGAVGVGLRIDYLQSMLAEYEEQFGVGVSLIDGDGIVQISPEYTGYEHIDFFDQNGFGGEIQREILNWNESDSARCFWNGEVTSDKRSIYMVSRYLPELEWHLVVKRDTAAIIENLNQQLTRTLIVILLIIFTILFIITYVIRLFNQKIIVLTKAVEEEKRVMFERATEQLFDNIYEMDVTHNRPANKVTEEYFENMGAAHGTTYDEALKMVADKQIKKEFREGYLDTFLSANVLKAYADGKESLSYDFMLSTGGDYYWMRIIACLIHLDNDDSIHMLTYHQNIDDERRKESKLYTMARTDEMTGLLTKTSTQRDIEGILAKKEDRIYAFFILDIDYFKQANDTFGHAFGDKVIIRFVEIVCSQFRKDDVIGRIGGDEFAVFIPVTDMSAVESKAADLSMALDTDYTSGDRTWHMSASIGVCVGNGQRCQFEDFYRSADDALYETKEQGRNSYRIIRKE